jgi:23S rRNA pseudouridine1911/1915/1917 synthase
VAPHEAGLSLEALWREALREALGGEVPRSRARAMIAAGAVSLDGVPCRSAGRRLRRGQRLEAAARVGALRPRTAATDRPFCLGPESILYRDAWLVAVAKPPGLPTHATADPRRPSLVGHLEGLLGAEGRAPYVAVHQRLDRDTSGVVLFATDPAANAGLARAFACQSVEKVYQALSLRPRTLPPRTFRVDVPLGRPASTDVRVLEVLDAVLLVEARPHTGRRHQVRAHLAHAGLPVVGDRVYGVGGEGAGRLMLHAARLSLAHPVSGAPLVVECPLPPDFSVALARAREAAARR